MTTITPEQQGLELARLEESEHQAWQAYSRSLDGLSGRTYEEAEDRSWSRLERKLSEIHDLRTKLARNTNSTK